jgi:hypothetical protein
VLLLSLGEAPLDRPLAACASKTGAPESVRRRLWRASALEP